MRAKSRGGGKEQSDGDRNVCVPLELDFEMVQHVLLKRLKSRDEGVIECVCRPVGVPEKKRPALSRLLGWMYQAMHATMALRQAIREEERQECDYNLED